MNPAGAMFGARGRLLLGAAMAVVGLLAPMAASAANDLLFQGKPVHPSCVHSLVTNQAGDPLPVPLVVSLGGCTASARAKIPVDFDGEISSISDEALLGGGSFGYKILSRFDNEIFVLGVRWTGQDGATKVSLAVVDLADRPMFRNGEVIQVPALELLALVPLRDAQFKSFRRSGNRVHVRVGTGPNAVDRMVDLTPLIKARRKK